MASQVAIFSPSDASTPGYYGPSQTALLLLDFHSLFVQKIGPKALAAVEVTAKLRKWAKSQGILIVHALVDTNAAPYPTCKDAGRLASIATSMRLIDGSGDEPPELAPNGDETDLTFTRRPGYVSALKSPGLEDLLQDRGIKSLILTGLSTSGCVMRTAVTSCDAEYVVSVISDGCADTDADVHDMMLNKILNNRSYVCTGEAFQNGYSAAMTGPDGNSA